MKDNLNIEELFKQKFDNFESQVDGSVWENVQQNIQPSAGTGTSGFGAIKVASIIGIVGIGAASIWYATSGDEEVTQDPEIAVLNEVEDENTTETSEVQPIGEQILVADTSDPVIQEKKNEIEKELSENQYNSDDIDDELLVSVLQNHNISNGFIVNQTNVNPAENPDVINEKEDKVDNNYKPEVVDNNKQPEKKELALNLKVNYQENNTIACNANAKNHTSVEWDFGDGTIEVGDKVEHTYERPGTYQLVMTAFGDAESQTVRKEVIIEGTSSLGVLPNVFTPNGDGRNDFFKIKSEGLDVLYVSIKDQSGVEVFTSNDPYFEWDGTKMDGEKAAGNFIVVVIAEGEDGQIFKEMKALRVE